jgi:hypothetical protein
MAMAITEELGEILFLSLLFLNTNVVELHKMLSDDCYEITITTLGTDTMYACNSTVHHITRSPTTQIRLQYLSADSYHRTYQRALLSPMKTLRSIFVPFLRLINSTLQAQARSP